MLLAETKKTLLALQKEGGNRRCMDCNAPNPQWAVPKFGIFICLECAGIHRGLGVHILFVRSITMDAFKPEEVALMQAGGNDACKAYLEAGGVGLDWPAKEKYDNYVAEEYKSKLAATSKGEEWVKPDNSGKTLVAPGAPAAAAPAAGSTEGFFAKLGAENDRRPDDVPPSQGGKYAGFGNTPERSATPSGGSLAGFTVDNFQKDPLGTLTKGWGLFALSVAKSADEINRSVIQPGVTKLQDPNLTADARRAMSQFGAKMQETGKYGAETFQRFTEGKPENKSEEGAFGVQKPEQKTKLEGKGWDEW